MLRTEKLSLSIFRKKSHPHNPKQGQEWEETERNDTLNVMDNNENRTPTLIIENHPQDSRVKIAANNIFQTLNGKMGTGGGNTPMVSENAIVRRLTPVECERLQGMPDDWSRYGIDENGKVYELSDGARYKLQGNGIATPFWKWLMARISAQYDGDHIPTLASLFDGQASFPMIWEEINGKGTALWSSEIEKHAIAVAKYHFPESEVNNADRD